MPFIIEAGQAARSICDGLERERTEIVFPADGPADEGRASSRPRVDGPVGPHLNHRTRVTPATPPMTRKNRRMP
jgi:hypothetical protein